MGLMCGDMNESDDGNDDTDVVTTTKKGKIPEIVLRGITSLNWLIHEVTRTLHDWEIPGSNSGSYKK